MGDDMVPVEVCFVPDAAELGRVRAAFAKARPWQATGSTVITGLILFLIGVLELISHNGLTHWVAYGELLFGAYFVSVGWNALKAKSLIAQPSAKIELTIDDAGITVTHPATYVPWKRISAIYDVGEAFVAMPIFGKSVPILKRALPDDGSALWALLDAKLTGTRYLVRGTGSRLRINNNFPRKNAFDR
ncbi:MAG: hypothetical protein IAI49_09100 [Candidatus Eremiobacteraeota bacterium]|nr:hypothetical protein [Candidatus Eremiobacteraeota bacterium]